MQPVIEFARMQLRWSDVVELPGNPHHITTHAAALSMTRSQPPYRLNSTETVFSYPRRIIADTPTSSRGCHKDIARVGRFGRLSRSA